MVKIVVLADIHGAVEPLKRMAAPLAEADVVLLAGDITDFGGAKQIQAVMETLNPYARRVLAVPGNCDPPEVGAYLTQAGVNLHGRGVCVDPWWFVGAGGTLPEMGRLPNEAGERLFTEALEKGFSECKNPDRVVLVTHQPAWNTGLDTLAPDRHAGNRAIRQFLDFHHPKLAASGHLHALAGYERVGSTTLVNPGPAKDGRYAVVDLTEKETRIHLFMVSGY